MKPRLAVLLSHPLHFRNWVSSGMAAQLATEWRLRLIMPRPLAEAGSAWIPEGADLVPLEPTIGGSIRRWMRQAFVLASMVAREPTSATYRHKLSQARPWIDRLQIGAFRRLYDSGVDLEGRFRRHESLRWRPTFPASAAMREARALLWPTLMHTHHQEVEVVKAAREFGYPILAAPASWDTLTSKGGWLVEPTHLLLWGEASRRHALTRHGHRPTRIAVTGPPHWDVYCSPLVGGSRRTVLVAGTSVNFWSDEHRLLRTLGETGAQDGFRVLFRPHPRGAWGWHMRDILPPGVSLDPGIAEQVACGHRGGWSLDPVDLAYYPRLMASVACVVAAFSTMVIEAALLGKPSFLVAFGESRHGPGGAGMHVLYEHMAEVAGWPGVYVCKTADELVKQVVAYLHGDLAHDPKALMAAAQTVARVDGHAQERILEAVRAWA